MPVCTLKPVHIVSGDDPDYADMTGHLNDESGMNELRNNYQYKSMKVSSTTKRAHIGNSGKVFDPSITELR